MDRYSIDELEDLGAKVENEGGIYEAITFYGLRFQQVPERLQRDWKHLETLADHLRETWEELKAIYPELDQDV